MKVNIELKTGIFWYPGLEEKTAGIVKEEKMEEAVIFSSFNHYSIRKIQGIIPSVETAYLRGIVTGLKSGVTRITALYRSKKYIATVKVKSHKLNKAKLILSNGGAYQLSLPKLSLNPKAAWKSSDQSVVKVNANGFVSARNEGTAVVEAAVKNETYQCTVTVVEALSNFDFKFDKTGGDNGEYTNYIDLTLVKGSDWYFWYDKAGEGTANRGIVSGDTYEDVIEAFGEAELVTVSSCDRFEQLFQASNYPRTAMIYKYRENQIDYCKKFYFDGNGNLVLVVWYR